jgi:chromosome partitioning protein
VTLVDSDPQGSAADWVEHGVDDVLGALGVVEAPTERLLARSLDRIGAEDVAIVDTPPGHERLLAKALERADVVVIPTRVGGVETARVEAVLDLVPKRLPAGLVFSSARTYTRDYQETVDMWVDAGVTVLGSVPERVGIAAGPDGWLSVEGLDVYGEIWRRVRRAARG